MHRSAQIASRHAAPAHNLGTGRGNRSPWPERRRFGHDPAGIRDGERDDAPCRPRARGYSTGILSVLAPAAPAVPPTSLDAMPSPDTDLRQINERIAGLQRAVYYLIWKRTGFGEQCIHCGHAYPTHENTCKAAEVEALVR